MEKKYEGYKTGDNGIVIYDKDNPLAWIKTSSCVNLENNL